MKHKDPMSDIALVGPGGRDKLKKLIQSLQDTAKEGENVEYVIAQALNELNDRIKALEDAPAPEPTTPHVLQVMETEENITLEYALELLPLDGETPTYEQLSQLDILNTVVLLQAPDKVTKMQITWYKVRENSIYIMVGNVNDELDIGLTIVIELHNNGEQCNIYRQEY